MVNWDAPNIKEFKKKAQNLQQRHFESLGDREWDVINSGDWTILLRKVGFGMYGSPGSMPTSNNRNTGYTTEQLDQIKKVCDQLVMNLDFENRNINFACIFIEGYTSEKHFTVPVFRAMKEKDNDKSSCVFVDTSACKYEDWIKYLVNNTLPECIFCCPKEGVYQSDGSNKVCVIFRERNYRAREFMSLLLSILNLVDFDDTTVNVADLAARSTAVPSTSVIGVERSTNAVVIPATHSQSIDIDVSNSLLVIVNACLSFVQDEMIAYMSDAAKAGEVMGKAGCIAFLVVQLGRLTINGIGIILGLAVLVDKNEQNEVPDWKLFQFSASLLFFAHAAVNLQSAKTIIKEVQKNFINSKREGLTEDALELFKKHIGQLCVPDMMHGNAKVVMRLNRIENIQDLYNSMVEQNVDNREVELTYQGYIKSMLEVNKNLKINMFKWMEIDPEDRRFISSLDLTQSFANTTKQSENEKNYKIYFESVRKDTLDYMCKLYNVNKVSDIKVGGRNIFANATPHEVDRLRVVLKSTLEENEDFIDTATKFAEKKGCTSTKDFLVYAEYFMADLTENTNKHVANHEKDLKAARIAQPKLNRGRFNTARGIKGSPRKYSSKRRLMSIEKTQI